jgi:hypothetical protein
MRHRSPLAGIVGRGPSATCRAARTGDALNHASNMYISSDIGPGQGRPGRLGARPSRPHGVGRGRGDALTQIEPIAMRAAAGTAALQETAASPLDTDIDQRM